jgi:hypothetical protein
MRRRPLLIVAAAAGLLLCSPGTSLAWSFIWPTEGSYVHQTAHLLFAGAMLFFIYEIFHAHLQKFRGFRYLLWTCGFLAVWNLDAVIGHWADWTLSNPVILGHGFGRRLLMYDFQTWVVYLTKIDHFVLLVPAFYLFYRGLKTLAQEEGDRSYD